MVRAKTRRLALTADNAAELSRVGIILMPTEDSPPRSKLQPIPVMTWDALMSKVEAHGIQWNPVLALAAYSEAVAAARGLKSDHMAMLAALVRCVDTRSGCTTDENSPSVSSLAKSSGMSRGRAVLVLDDLCATGLLVRTPRIEVPSYTRVAHAYRLLIPDVSALRS